MHMFTASAQDELILTNTGMNSSRRMNLLYNDSLTQPHNKKSDQPFTPLTSTVSTCFSNPLDGAERLHGDFNISRQCWGYMTASFLTIVVCKYLWTSLFIPRLLPQAHLSWYHVLYLNPYYFKLGRRLLFNWLCIQNQQNWLDL